MHQLRKSSTSLSVINVRLILALIPCTVTKMAAKCALIAKANSAGSIAASLRILQMLRMLQKSIC